MTTRTANYDRTALAVIVALSLAARTDALRAQAPTPGSGGAASRARAVRHSCTDRDFEGTFAVFGSGFILASPATGLIGPIARVGIFEADGAGHLKFRSRAAFNGIHFQQSFSGTYTMRPDCTFLSLVELPFSHPSIQPFVLPSTFLGILADQGREMTDIVMSPPGAVVYGRARKQTISRCTVRDLFGSYQIDLNGSTLDLGFPLPFSGGGRLEADGNGNINGQVAFNSGGFTVPGNISGSYTVATDCTFEMNYCVLAKDGRTCQRTYGLHGALLNDGDAAYVIVTEPNTAVILGGLKAQ